MRQLSGLMSAKIMQIIYSSLQNLDLDLNTAKKNLKRDWLDCRLQHHWKNGFQLTGMDTQRIKED